MGGYMVRWILIVVIGVLGLPVGTSAAPVAITLTSGTLAETVGSNAVLDAAGAQFHVRTFYPDPYRARSFGADLTLDLSRDLPGIDERLTITYLGVVYDAIINFQAAQGSFVLTFPTIYLPPVATHLETLAFDLPGTLTGHLSIANLAIAVTADLLGAFSFIGKRTADGSVQLWSLNRPLLTIVSEPLAAVHMPEPATLILCITGGLIYRLRRLRLKDRLGPVFGRITMNRRP